MRVHEVNSQTMPNVQGSANSLPQKLQDFLHTLTPTDNSYRGPQTVGIYRVHYEGFTDECNDGYDNNSITGVYDEVWSDHNDREAKLRRQPEAKPIYQGYLGRLGCNSNPILFSVYYATQHSHMSESEVINFDHAQNPERDNGARLNVLLAKYGIQDGWNRIKSEPFDPNLYERLIDIYLGKTLSRLQRIQMHYATELYRRRGEKAKGLPSRIRQGAEIEIYSFVKGDSYVDDDVRDEQDLIDRLTVLMKPPYSIPPEDIKVSVDGEFINLPEFGISNRYIPQ